MGCQRHRHRLNLLCQCVGPTLKFLKSSLKQIVIHTSYNFDHEWFEDYLKDTLEGCDKGKCERKSSVCSGAVALLNVAVARGYLAAADCLSLNLV